ncbi:DUF11 domain-containing protein [Planobispora longispora]|uniref:DUF11 domain-containing protein n=1 Tax=Planobispora longispora TaxID=28887 RepID=A0A8J3W944_9ACTN|nr:DUF11 domain-containing protein [Planobispora longispora]BFE85515.1 hypothetical protein GCM10020093_081160 [Planobispora longispora]GIH80403.1 hypothetical protein Plo01_68320 [Planobispora longispora]
MRRHLTAFAATALAGGMLLVPHAASAQTHTAPARTAAQQSAPLSPIKLTASYPRRAYAGKTITYTLKAKNVGDWYSDIVYVGGYVPKQARKVQITGPSGSYCDVDGREVGCLLDTLNPGKSATVKVKVWLRSGASGTATAEFASASIDVPAGGLDTLNIHGVETGVDLKYVKVKTRIVR